MLGLIKALGVVKLAAVTALLTTIVAAAAVQPSLPTQASQGQARAAAGAANRNPRAAAGAANGNAPSQPATSESGQGPDKAAVVARLGQNRDRVLASLNRVLARLQGSKANSHATDALQKVIDRIANGTVGLNHAAQVVASHGAGNASLPGPAANHATPDNHPGRP